MNSEDITANRDASSVADTTATRGASPVANAAAETTEGIVDIAGLEELSAKHSSDAVLSTYKVKKVKHMRIEPTQEERESERDRIAKLMNFGSNNDDLIWSLLLSMGGAKDTVWKKKVAPYLIVCHVMERSPVSSSMNEDSERTKIRPGRLEQYNWKAPKVARR